MIKTLIKHFIFEQCIDITFNQITDNFIKPDMTNVRIQECMNRLHKDFPDVKILRIFSQSGKSRYASTSEMLGDQNYYRTVKFADMSNIFND